AALFSDIMALYLPRLVDLMMTIVPFCLFGLYLAIAPFLPLWGKGINRTTRLRLYVAAAVPGLFASLALTLGWTITGAKHYFVFSFISIPILWFIDWITARRGAVALPNVARPGLRALAFTGANFVVYMGAYAAAAGIAAFWSMNEVIRIPEIAERLEASKAVKEALETAPLDTPPPK
ncbi:MAG: hypothetical protein AAFQ67_08030, partial [Pseudomonadota bacterium]